MKPKTKRRNLNPSKVGNKKSLFERQGKKEKRGRF